MASIKLTHAKAANEALPCSLSSCRRPRSGLSAWCRTCTGPALRYGHPLAKPLRPSRWARQRAEVEALFAAHSDHPGKRQVEQSLQAWMVDATNGGTYKGATEVRRLAAAGVSAERLLVELCAAWVFQTDEPRHWPDDRSRAVFLSRAICSLAPRPRRPCGGRPGTGTWRMPASASYSPKASPSALAHIGPHLRQTFAVFLATVQHGIERTRQLKADPQADQRQPFALPFPVPGVSR